jgi:hypothetical protein
MSETEPVPAPAPDFICGLDLGKSADFSALAIMERTSKPDEAKPDKAVYHYACRHLQRWPLQTTYTSIIADLAAMLAQEPLAGNCQLVVDGTGVGAAVVEMVRAAKLPAKLVPVLITAGHAVTKVDGTLHVPKRELASTLVTVLQTGRLKIALLPEREILERELGLFRVKVTSAGNETYEAWRERDHDDLVLSTALALFVGERPQKEFRFLITDGVWRQGGMTGPFAARGPTLARGWDRDE